MNHFFKNIAWLSCGHFLTQIIAFALNIVLFRQLGAEGLGLYSALFVFINSVGLILYWDTGNVLIHGIAQSDDSQTKRDFAHQGWSYSLINSVLYSGIFILFAYFFSQTLFDLIPNEQIQLKITNYQVFNAILLTGLIPFFSFPLIWSQNVLRGHEKMKSASFIFVLHNTCRPLGALIGFLMMPRFDVMLTIILIFLSTATIVSLIITNKEIPGLLKTVFSTIFHKPHKKLIVDSVYLTIDKKFVEFYELLPRQLLAVNPGALAFYDIIHKLANIPTQLFNPISASLLPRLTQTQMQQGWNSLKQKINKVIFVGGGFGILLLIVTAIACWHVILPHHFFYHMNQADFTAVTQAGIYALLTLPLLAMGSVCSSLTLILDKIKTILKLKILLAFLLVPLAAFLIHKYDVTGACQYYLTFKVMLIMPAFVILMKNLVNK